MSEVTRLQARIDVLEERRARCEEQADVAGQIAQDCALQGDPQGASEWGRRALHERRLELVARGHLVRLRADLVAAEEFPDEDSARAYLQQIAAQPAGRSR
jgi:hypothetical protein